MADNYHIDEASNITPEQHEKIAAMLRAMTKKSVLPYMPAGGQGYIEMEGGGRMWIGSTPSYPPSHRRVRGFDSWFSKPVDLGGPSA